MLVALVLLGVAWSFAPASAPPLYDGVGFPDEPYRFVAPPPHAKPTKPPTAASGTAAIIGGRSGVLGAASAESAPQVSVQIPPGQLRVPPGTSFVRLVARPEAMLPAPPGRYLWSNVYDLVVTPAATRVAGDQVATITLRAVTAQQPLPFIATFNAGRWTLSPTSAVGRDIYAAPLTSFGRFAVVGEAPLDLSQVTTGGGKKGGAAVGVAVGLGVLALVVVLFFAGRRRRVKEQLGSGARTRRRA